MKKTDNNDNIQAKGMIRLLDASLERLDPEIIQALHAGRQSALQHQRSKPAFWPGISALALRWPLAAQHPHLLAMLPLLLILGVGTLTYWQQESHHDNSHIDVAILTDDMPIEVFVDPHHY